MYLFGIQIRNLQKKTFNVYIDLDSHKRLIITSSPRIDNTDPEIKQVLRVMSKVLDRRLQPLVYSPIRSDFYDLIRGSMENVEIELNDAFYNDPTCYKLGTMAYYSKPSPVPEDESEEESSNAIFSTIDDNTSLSDIL